MIEWRPNMNTICVVSTREPREPIERRWPQRISSRTAEQLNSSSNAIRDLRAFHTTVFQAFEQFSSLSSERANSRLASILTSSQRVIDNNIACRALLGPNSISAFSQVRLLASFSAVECFVAVAVAVAVGVAVRIRIAQLAPALESAITRILDEQSKNHKRIYKPKSVSFHFDPIRFDSIRSVWFGLVWLHAQLAWPDENAPNEIIITLDSN